jgi:hypothetical protein
MFQLFNPSSRHIDPFSMPIGRVPQLLCNVPRGAGYGTPVEFSVVILLLLRLRPPSNSNDCELDVDISSSASPTSMPLHIAAMVATVATTELPVLTPASCSRMGPYHSRPGLCSHVLGIAHASIDLCSFPGCRLSYPHHQHQSMHLGH